MSRIAEYLLVATGAALFAQQVGGDAPQPPPHSQLVTRSIQIVDAENRVRAELGTAEPPNDSIALRFFDIQGKEKVTLLQSGDQGGKLWMHDADGRVYLQIADVADPGLRVRGGFIRLLGESGGKVVTCQIQPDVIRLRADDELVLTVPEPSKPK